jgi:uridine kinase
VSGTVHPPHPTADLVATWPLGKSLVVGIAGGSASGKSLIAQELVSQVGGAAVAVLEHDGYYHHRPDLPFEERAAINYDHPDSFETDLMLEHLHELVAGRRVLKPRYDFAAHLRMDETVVVEPRPVVLIEGLMILAEPELRRRCDLKIYVDADADLRLLRRLRRDTRDRGRTFVSVIDQYEATVRPMHLQFVEPSKRYADIIIPEGFKPSAVRTVGGMLRDHLRQSPVSTVSTP